MNFSASFQITMIGRTVFLILVFRTMSSSGGGMDVEDWISSGYTCSLADPGVETDQRRPGVEIVCDDGVCAQCVKTDDGVKPWLMKHSDLDPEDYLRHGFVCSEEFRDDRDAERVCDDGHCVGCKVGVDLILKLNF